MAYEVTAPCEYIIKASDGDQRLGVRILSDGTTYINRHDSSGVFVEACATLNTTGDWTFSGDVSVTGTLTATTVTSTEGEVSYRTVANDGAVDIGRLDAGGVIEILNSTTGTKSITTDTSGANAVALGQEVTIFLTACTGNSYTLALSTGTLTFNAALETAKIVRTSLGWNVVSLNGATIV